MRECASAQWLQTHSPNDVIESGQTALHIACAEKQHSIVKLLLKKGASSCHTYATRHCVGH